jgi:ATP-dependent helicase HrpA
MCAADREFTLLAATAGLGRSLFDEVADRAVADALDLPVGRHPQTAVDFDAIVDRCRERVADCGTEVVRVAKSVLMSLKEARAALAALGAPIFAGPRDSVVRQLDGLLAPGWVRHTPEPWFHQLPKYVRAAARRAERIRNEVERDRKLQSQVVPYEAALHEIERAADPARPAPERERLRWMIEEFRVSLFAQEMKTLTPVSAKRLDEQLRLARSEK